MSYQQITVLGNVGQAAELRFTPSGTPVATFSLAVNETFVSNGEKKQNTTWFRVTMWAKLAESITEHITKGKQLLVVGTVTARAYQDRNGELQASLEIRADQIRFVGSKSDSQGSYSQGDPTDNVSVDNGESIPF